MAIKILPHQLKRQISNIKENYFFPSLKALKGNVLEIGFGKGENFKYYSEKCSVFAIDKKIDNEHLKKVQNIARCKLNVQRVDGEQLQFADEFFDVIIGSFVLCSVESVEKTLFEMSRVLKKGGKIIFIEHIQSNNYLTKTFQKVLTFVQKLFSISCHLDRDPRHVLSRNKFQIIYEKVFPNSLEPYLYLEAIKQ